MLVRTGYVRAQSVVAAKAQNMNEWRPAGTLAFEAVITLTSTVVAYNELERASRVHQSAVWKYATCWSSVTCRQSDGQHILWQAD